MAFYNMKSLALAAAMAISAAGVQAATIELFAVPGAAVANPTPDATGGASGIYHDNVIGSIDYDPDGLGPLLPDGPGGDGDARSVWAGTALEATGVYSSVSAQTWAEFSFASAKSVLELVWGTVDFGAQAENVITFFLGGVATGHVVTGADVLAAGGPLVLPTGTVATGVTISGVGLFDSIRLSNSRSHDAFEFANLTASVPLPAGGLLLISALGAAAALRRRKTV